MMMGVMFNRSKVSRRTIRVTATLMLAACATMTGQAHAAIPAYMLVGSYSKAAAGTGAFDFDAQGRMVVLTGNQLLRQDSVNSSTFTTIGSIPSGFVDGFSGASFIRFSPDGTRLAIGNGVFGAGASVGVIDLSTLGGSPSPLASVAMDNYTGTWVDNSTLLVAGGGAVGTITSTINSNTLTGRTIINGVDGASGGVAYTGTHILAANGFDFGPGTGSNSGEIRAIPFATAMSSSTPINFETGMTPIAHVLSGSPLEFDPFGNLLVGGGDVFGTSGDFGYAGIVDGDALTAALNAGVPASPLLASSLNLLPPGVPINASTALRFNTFTNELIFTYYDNNTFNPGATVFRYAVPAPGSLAVLAGAGLLAARRRR